MNKKVVLLALTLALATTAFMAGCSGKTEEKTETGTATESPKETVTYNVGVKPDVPKFGYLNPDTNKYEGFEIDLAQAVADKLAGPDKTAKLNFTSVTPKTRGPLLDNGELDFIAATFTVTEERKLSFNFSQAYFTDAVRVMVKKDSGIKSFKDLDGKTIGVAQAATSMNALKAEADRLGITIKFSEYATYPEIKAALDSGRVDAFSVDGAILAGYIDDKTTLLPEKLTPQEYGIATKLSNTELAGKIDTIIGDMKADGSLDELLAKWKLN